MSYDQLRTELAQQSRTDYLELTRRHGIIRLLGWTDRDAAREAMQRACEEWPDTDLDVAVRHVFAAAFNLGGNNGS